MPTSLSMDYPERMDTDMNKDLYLEIFTTAVAQPIKHYTVRNYKTAALLIVKKLG